jgi:amino acid transporter
VASRKKKGATKNDGVMGIFGYRGGGDKPRKKQVLQYDKQGNLLGDDGLEMTKVRKRMHRIFDGWFIYVAIMVLLAIAFTVLAFFQGAQYTDWDAVQRGGNEFHGWQTAFLLRIEALMCLYTAILSGLISVFGFRWFYDRKTRTVVYGLMFALGAVCISYFGFAVLVVGTLEPISLINLCFIIITLQTMAAVDAERPTLRKPKIGRREVK